MKTATLLFSFLLSLTSFVFGQQKTSPEVMEAFMNKRFGMFIHWGPVSLRGTEIGWSRDREVPKEDYDSLYKEFNPVLFDADQWVRTAKAAGMKYLTITARHHDGFSIWPSEFTDYDIMNTPYKKDILDALNKACKKHGIEFCIYYSILDWYHPDYPIHSAHTKEVDPEAEMDAYVTFMKNQLKELITNYDPYMLWFDGQWESPWTDEMGKEMYSYLKTLKPDLIINNRLGKEMAGVKNEKVDPSKIVGDYDTPEQVVGHMNMEIPWESCFTICQQWAWKPNDQMKSLEESLKILSQTIGGNGNLLLNVGPMPDGRIEMRQIKRLEEIGDWVKSNSEAIYGTLGGPFPPTANYATTRKGNNIYVHVLNTDVASIELKNIPEIEILEAHTSDGTPVTIQKENGQFKIILPSELSGKLQYIVTLEMNSDIEQTPVIE